MKKWSARPSACVASPPLKDSGPRRPLATNCSTRPGVAPRAAAWMKAAQMSMQPTSAPPIAIVRTPEDIALLGVDPVQHARERDGLAEVIDPADPRDEPLDAEAEARV